MTRPAVSESDSRKFHVQIKSRTGSAGRVPPGLSPVKRGDERPDDRFLKSLNSLMAADSVRPCNHGDATAEQRGNQIQIQQRHAGQRVHRGSTHTFTSALIPQCTNTHLIEKEVEVLTSEVIYIYICI